MAAPWGQHNPLQCSTVWGAVAPRANRCMARATWRRGHARTTGSSREPARPFVTVSGSLGGVRLTGELARACGDPPGAMRGHGPGPQAPPLSGCHPQDDCVSALPPVPVRGS